MKNPETKNIAVGIDLHSEAKQRAAAEKITLQSFTETALKDLLRRKQPATKHPKKG